MKSFSFLTASLTACSVLAANPYYKIESIPLPPGEVLEAMSIALLPDQKVAVGTRRGEIWIASGAYGDDLSKVSWQRFAQGLQEPGGMHWKDSALYVQQRGEYSKLSDYDNDGQVDEVENICDAWGLSADYHEYAFGSMPDADGNVYAVLCLSGSAGYKTDWRGWGVQITPEGVMHPYVSGIRSPGGVGYNAAGDLFYTDNQGLWNGSSSLKWMRKGGFMGNPSGNPAAKKFGLEEPPTPESGSRMLIEREKDPRIVPPAVIFPHARVGQSPTAVLADHTAGKFGPFAEQTFVGEQTHSQVQRVTTEKVKGLYQGAVYPFLDGYACGIVPMKMANDGTLFVGGTNRGWGSRGNAPFSFQRTRWTGQVPFEMKEVNITSDGFKVIFTDPVKPSVAVDPKNWKIQTWSYIYQKSYGSPEVDHGTSMVETVTLSDDSRVATLKLAEGGLRRDFVHYIQAPNVVNQKGEKLWHSEAYYTVNEIPD